MQRIISLAPSITETIFALNQNHRLVGVTEYCTFPEEANGIAKIGGFQAPDIPSMLAHKPDMVLCTTMHSLEKLQPIADAGIAIKQVVALKLFDAPNMLIEVGKAIDKEAEAIELGNEIQNQIDDILQQASYKPKKRVCYLCTSNPFCGWKPKCQTNELVTKLGGVLTAYEKDNLAQSIVDSDPEIIVIPYSTDKEDYKIQAKFVEDNPILKETTAFKNNKMVQMNGELLSRPGPRAGEGLRRLFNIIHS